MISVNLNLYMLSSYCSFNGEDQGMQACIDEVGRGSWAGRVYTAAVVWNSDIDDEFSRQIKDSKRLSPAKRELLADYIRDNALDFAVTYMDPSDIDRLNILQATMHSMHNALDALHVKIDSILVDGNQFKRYKEVPHRCVVKGDNKYIGIACASILAKVEHDAHMREIAVDFPEYVWEKNMGYGSPSHLAAIESMGVCKHHRLSFNPMKAILEGEEGREGARLSY